MAQKRAERATIEASIEKLEAIIPPLQERVEIRRHLLKQEIGVRTPISDRTLLVRSEGSRCKKTGMARPMLRSPLSLRRAARYAEYERGLLTSLPKPSKRRRRRTARYSHDRRPGDLAKALTAIVPAETHLEIEEMISNRHIGSVEVGQHVAIKADTFNFTPLWPAVWKGCHRRSRRHYPRQATRTSNRATAQGVETSTSEPKGQELIYATRMSLDHTQMKVERRKVNLSPRHGRHGRDQDRIMSYLLSPFIRYKHETLRER